MTSLPVDQVDLILLNALQDEFPLGHTPWDSIGEKTGLSGEEVLLRLKRMADAGILRGISPILESTKRKSGFSTLVALRVPEERIAEIAAIINGYPEISHNFRRSHEFNLWFTLAAETMDKMESIINNILIQTGIKRDAMLSLMTVQRYKIEVIFPLIQRSGGDTDGRC